MKQKYSKKSKKWIYITTIIFILILDISSKRLIIKYIKTYDTKKIFSVLNFFHVHNHGAAFSFLSDQNGWQKWFLSTVSMLTILVMTRIITKLKKQETKKITAYSLIIAGATGNLIDRIFYGFVVDFIDIHINDWHFATFNIADCSIFIGIIILMRINYST
ncbi:signal peptidase II [Buchnera aphidicola]|uniref:Lipoprotein signal peptidase n=1 Tax=Buchnera aphidicola subsp. Acyrthosiphon pisum (strain 5A) TaxID=563178 RepID=LSPA_BUCA5|nr:signal peptidase II [Buchnera aphidicola]B8D8U9.1 RecName: Full=Lipoprotein signal peptidase; AltName: Full=Prolipoprotein signal peptidase; AltName: Full=Signal peptidase II; Short=SPase II [Buchnera aphidicola str. 5A (Acyrthosiphon pisum)]ACL30521.1 lipoprotein signal peptidase [Buchnera aphidicola str. 5A (Acyrthosiphon pisum)]